MARDPPRGPAGTGADRRAVLPSRRRRELRTAGPSRTRLFARQIDWLESHFELISLGETQRRIRAGHNARPCGQHHVRRRLRRELPSGDPAVGRAADPLHLLRHAAQRPDRRSRFSTTSAIGSDCAAQHARTASRDGGRGHRDRRPRPPPRRSRRDPRPGAALRRSGHRAGRTRGRAGPPDPLSSRFRSGSTRVFRATPSRWPERPATRACARPTAATTFPATTRSTCSGSTSTTT